MLKQRTLILKIIVLFVPIILMASTYFFYDPFMVLKRYDRYDISDTYLNESYVGWETYKTHKDSLKYDSFILGNSGTMGIHTQDWEQYLDGGVAFRFFDNAERLGGVINKLEVLDKHGATIKNILIVLDPGTLDTYMPNQTFMHVLPPDAAQIGDFQFHLKMLQGYLKPEVMSSYLYYKATGKISPALESKCIVTQYKLREAYTNNGLHPMGETIKEIGDKYWQDAGWVVDDNSPRQIVYKQRFIYADQIRGLMRIKQICDKHNADMTFLISPRYMDYDKLNPEDLRSLQDIFGAQSVFDLTGVDQFVRYEKDFYDPDHFRPVLGIRILDYVYGIKKQAPDSTVVLN